MPIRTMIILTVTLLGAVAAWGQPTETEQLKVELVSDSDSVQPGKPLRLGLHFEMKDHWHIYWRNPGDSGLPPQVSWVLPAGFQAGNLQWPAPQRLGSGSVIDYGYQASLLLPVELQTPVASLAPGSTVTLAVEVKWLVCKDVCVPGQAKLNLSLPVRLAPGPAPAAHAWFQEAQARLPKSLPTDWKIAASSEPEHFVLTILGAGQVQPYFFPLVPDQIENGAPQTVARFPAGLRLILKKSDQLTGTPARLEGVLDLGAGRVYAISAPVVDRPEQSTARSR